MEVCQHISGEVCHRLRGGTLGTLGTLEARRGQPCQKEEEGQKLVIRNISRGPTVP